MCEADCLAQPRPVPIFGEWGTAGEGRSIRPYLDPPLIANACMSQDSLPAALYDIGNSMSPIHA